MASVALRQRVVEVIADLGKTSDQRWRYGSGLLIGDRQVLTAAHVVIGAVAVTVRWPDKVALGADLDMALVGDPDRLDLALLAVPAAPALPNVDVALVNRDVTTGEVVIEDCWAVGYPSFQEIARDAAGSSVRETAQVLGRIPPLSGLVGDLLSLQVTATPQPLPAEQTRLGQSEWSGMSGAAVFAGEALVGVVTEHAPRRGSSEVTVIPLDRLMKPATAPPDAADWWARLGVRGLANLQRLPAPPVSEEPPYWATVREFGRTLHRRMPRLLGREQELAEIAAFATGAAGYRRLVGGAYAGKTALLLEAVTAGLPDEVDVVCYFLSRRASDADSSRFLAAVVPQLAYLCKVDPPAAADAHQFRALWERATQRAAETDRPLLLVVDGLDEDLRPTGLPSVASLLPEVEGRTHVLVASRPHPKLANDVTSGHPLTTTDVVELQPFQGARELADRARQEIDSLTDGHDSDLADLAVDVLGLLTAAAGPLSVRDLAFLSNDLGPLSPAHSRRVRDLVTKRAARSLEPIGSTEPLRYQFAHYSLLEYAKATEDLTDPEYRRRIHLWFEQWRERGWPTSPDVTESTPRYLLESYPATLADDPSRLTALVSNVGWVDAALQSMGVDQVVADLRSAAATEQATPAVVAMLATVSGQVHQLRPPAPVTQPGYVLRQLWMQAAELGEDELASDLRARLQNQPDSGLIPIWTTRRTSRALLSELGRHDDSVHTVAVMLDGRVVSSGDDGRVLVWDPSRPGSDPVELGGHDGSVGAVAVLADGRVVSGAGDGRVLVWDPSQPGSGPVELGRHDVSVSAVAVLPDGRVVSGGNDKRVLVWDPAQPGTNIELGRHDSWVSAVAVLPDGRVVSGGDDRRVLIWSATQGQVAQLACSVMGLAVEARRGDASLVVIHEGQGFSFWSTTRGTTMGLSE